MEKVNLRGADLTTLTPALMVVTCENEKVVFANGVNIGYITPDGIFYVKKDYFKGGTKHTVFTGQFLEIIEKTYQLAGSTTEEHTHALLKSVKELGDLRESLNREKDPVKVKAIVEHAAMIVREFGNEPNKKRFADIEAKSIEILNPVVKAPIIPPVKIVDPAKAALEAAKKNAKLKLNDLKVQLKGAKTKKAKKPIEAEIKKIKKDLKNLK